MAISFAVDEEVNDDISVTGGFPGTVSFSSSDDVSVPERFPVLDQEQKTPATRRKLLLRRKLKQHGIGRRKTLDFWF
ncbi:hypothetical protein LINGRAHAP2_LOCUS29242 [Linum grandiflorum]